MYLETLVNYPHGVTTLICFEYNLARREFNPNCTVFDIEFLSIEGYSENGKKLDYISLLVVDHSEFLRQQLVKKAHEIELEKKS